MGEESKGKEESKEVTIEKELKYLIPKEDVENDFLIGELKKAIKEKKVQNIGITGPYGSGKTTLVKRLDKEIGRGDFIYISLADFTIEDKSEEEPVNRDQEKNGIGLTPKEREAVERSILQQILYQEKPIFFTWKKIVVILFVLINILYIVPEYGYLIKAYLDNMPILNRVSTIMRALNKISDKIPILNRIPDLDKIPILNYWWNNNRSIILTTNCFAFFNELSNKLWILRMEVILSIIMIILYKVKGSYIVTKINLFNFGAEFKNKDGESSALSENIKWIVKFFKKNKYKVAVIEDLDRFKEASIFVKLREVNTILNGVDGIDLTFIYCARDDIFNKPNERVKFFELIVPIIPVIDMNNSESKLQDYFKEEIDRGVLDKGILDDVALYIDDMRLLRNIYNEYKIYADKLGENKNIDKEKNEKYRKRMFGMMVYKNLCPKDFSKLKDNRGTLYYLLNDYKEKELKRELEESSKKLEALENDLKEVIQELNGKTKGLINSVKIEELKDKKIKKMFEINEIRKRIEVISMRPSKKSKELDYSKIYEELEGEQDDFELLVTLISNELIDEEYLSCMSYFYEGNLTWEDKAFLKGLKGGRKYAYNYPIDDVEKVVKKLRQDNYRKKGILNYNILKYLQTKKENYENEYRDSIRTLLSVTHKQFMEFCKGYFEHLKEKNTKELYEKYIKMFLESLIEEIKPAGNGNISMMIKNSNAEKEFKKDFLIKLATWLDEEVLKKDTKFLEVYKEICKPKDNDITVPAIKKDAIKEYNSSNENTQDIKKENEDK